MLRNTAKTGKTRPPPQSPTYFSRSSRRQRRSRYSRRHFQLPAPTPQRRSSPPQRSQSPPRRARQRRQNLPDQPPHPQQIQPQRAPNRRTQQHRLENYSQHQIRQTQCLGLRRTRNLPRHPPIFPYQTQPLPPRVQLSHQRRRKPPRILADTDRKLRRRIPRHHRRQQVRRTTPGSQPQSLARQISQHQSDSRNLLPKRNRNRGTPQRHPHGNLRTQRSLRSFAPKLAPSKAAPGKPRQRHHQHQRIRHHLRQRKHLGRNRPNPTNRTA